MSNLAVELAESFDFECTGADDHDSPVCRKCARLRTALIALLRRAGEGSQAAPLTQNDLEEMAVTWIATEPTIAVSFGHVRENGVFQRLVNLLVQVRGAPAAGSGTFAEGIEAAAQLCESRVDKDGWRYGNREAEQCAIAIRALAQEKREPAPAPDKSGEK